MSVKDGFQKIISEISSRYKYVHGDKGKLEKPYSELKKWHPENDVNEIWRFVGLESINLTWFLFCLMKFTAKDTKNGLKTLFVDNRIIDAFYKEKQKTKITDKDSFFKKFFKNLQLKHPKAAARLHLWMLYALFTGLTVSGIKITKHKDDIKQTYKELVSKTKESQIHESKIKIDYETFKESLKPITPLLITDLIAKEGVKLDENGLHEPYKDSNGIWTIGFGSTVLKNGMPVTAKTPHITNEQAYELARWHIEDYETYPMLYWYYVYDNDLLFETTNEAIGICSVFYNAANNLVENKRDKNNRERFTILRKYRDGNTKIPCNGYGPNIPDSLILECFNKHPITKKFSFGEAWLNHQPPQKIANTLINFCADGGGIFWRRWLEAGLLTGDINPCDLLECPINGMADFHKYMGGWIKNNNARKQALWQQNESEWQPKDGSYDDFKNWLQQPMTKDKTGRPGLVVRQKVKEYLPNDILQYIMNQKYDVNQKINYKKKNKKIAFNNGIKKIQNKQQDNLNFYSQHKDYLA